VAIASIIWSAGIAQADIIGFPHRSDARVRMRDDLANNMENVMLVSCGRQVQWRLESCHFHMILKNSNGNSAATPNRFKVIEIISAAGVPYEK
jgi:hypothetical protein